MPRIGPDLDQMLRKVELLLLLSALLLTSLPPPSLPRAQEHTEGGGSPCRKSGLKGCLGLGGLEKAPEVGGSELDSAGPGRGAAEQPGEGSVVEARCEQRRGAYMDSLGGHEAMRLVTQDRGCKEAAMPH